MASTSQRLFVALRPDDAATTELQRAVGEARGRLTGLEGADAIRWIPAERWHLTVLFLGSVEKDRVAAVTEAGASAAAGTDTFLWQLSGCRASPSVSRARVLWSPAQATGDSLARLHRAMRRMMRSAGQSVERRPYHAHLTIARVRSRFPEVRDAVRAAVQSLGELHTQPVHATRVVLLRSQLGPEPRYDELARWALPG